MFAFLKLDEILPQLPCSLLRFDSNSLNTHFERNFISPIRCLEQNVFFPVAFNTKMISFFYAVTERMPKFFPSSMPETKTQTDPVHASVELTFLFPWKTLSQAHTHSPGVCGANVATHSCGKFMRVKQLDNDDDPTKFTDSCVCECWWCARNRDYNTR